MSMPSLLLLSLSVLAHWGDYMFQDWDNMILWPVMCMVQCPREHCTWMSVNVQHTRVSWDMLSPWCNRMMSAIHRERRGEDSDNPSIQIGAIIFFVHKCWHIQMSLKLLHLPFTFRLQSRKKPYLCCRTLELQQHQWACTFHDVEVEQERLLPENR